MLPDFILTWIFVGILAIGCSQSSAEDNFQPSRPGCCTVDTITMCYKVQALEEIRNKTLSDELVLIECNLDYITFNDFPERLRTIRIENCDVGFFESNVFAKLSNLREIFISHLNLVSLNSVRNIFDGVTSLRGIYFANSGLNDEIPAFSDLSGLIELDLNNNYIPYLSKDVFEGLDNLKTLKLNNNNLPYVNQFTFEHLKSLTTLIIHSNVLDGFQNTSFSGLTCLKKLDLSNNYFLNISPDMFSSDLGALEYLYLNNTRLETIEPNAFQVLVSLRVLILDNNDITSLGNGVFNGLSNVNTLSLAYNEFDTLSADIFENLSGLVCLEIDQKFQYIQNAFQIQNRSVTVIFPGANE